MPKHNKYTKDQLENIVINCYSISQVLKKLGLRVAGGNYHTIRTKISEFDIDTNHFLGKGWSANKKLSPKRPIEDYLDNKYQIKSSKLKARLIKEGLKLYICEICKLSEWLDKPLTLELDHIDGNHFNNNLKNLRILCPNCHSQTSTFRGRNIPRSRE